MNVKEKIKPDGSIEILKEFRTGGHYTHLCMKFKTELSFEDGTVTATYMNYLGEVQEDFNDSITFKVGEAEISYQAFSGVATCPISGESGVYEVSTANTGIDNGTLEVTI